MTNLDRAKELRDKNYSNIKSNRCPCKNCKVYYKDLEQDVKQLKEKVDKGCDRSDWVDEYIWIDCDNDYKCKDCQETLKILEGILE